MRLLAVTDAIPQNSCAPITTSSSSFPAVAPSASSRICAGGAPVGEPSAPSYDWIANVKPSSRTKPAIHEVQIDRTMPLGPAVDASCVSSVMCAEASYPVKVYCAISSPSSTTYTPLPQPVLLTNSPNTNEAD